MRSVRRSVDQALPVAGIIMVLAAVLFLWQNLYLQLAVVIAGIVLIEAGIWKLAHPLLPSQRKYRALRTEVDDFIDLVRRLNAAGVEREAGAPGAIDSVAAVKREMLVSVDRMVDYAGKETDPAAGARSSVST
jgi:hypothetical protein